MSREKAPIVVVNTQEAVVLSKHDRITVDWNAKLQNKHKSYWCHLVSLSNSH